MEGTENDQLAEKLYNPFLVNKALSYHADTIGYANMMNMRNHIDNKLMFDFYKYIIRSRKRYAKWSKNEEDANVELMKVCYGYNQAHSKSALSILTSEQIEKLREQLERGGK
jgi:hypothetical protein